MAAKMREEWMKSKFGRSGNSVKWKLTVRGGWDTSTRSEQMLGLLGCKPPPVAGWMQLQFFRKCKTKVVQTIAILGVQRR